MHGRDRCSAKSIIVGIAAGVILVIGVLFYFFHSDNRHSCPSGSEPLYAYRYNAALKQPAMTFIGCGMTEEK